MAKRKPIQWHPAFTAAVQLELIRWQAWLEYIPEHSLSKKPLAADLLVIKKGRTWNLC